MVEDSEARDFDAELEREILEGRKFSMEEAVARMIGPGIKGQSPITGMEQAAVEIESWLVDHLTDAGGALMKVLVRRIKSCEVLLTGFHEPQTVLRSYCEQLLASDYLLGDLVRETDMEWGRLMGERPHFDQAVAAPHPDDPYTARSLRDQLTGLVAELGCGSSTNADSR